jgi:hypothetical protein
MGMVIAMIITGFLGTSLMGQVTQFTCSQTEQDSFMCEVQLRGDCPEITSYLEFIRDALRPLKYDAECITRYELSIGKIPNQATFLIIGLLIIIWGIIRVKTRGIAPRK